jgi:hypothetical protein
VTTDAARDAVDETWGAITVGVGTSDGSCVNRAWQVGREYADRIAAELTANFGQPDLENVFTAAEGHVSDEVLARLETPMIVKEGLL